MTEVKTRIPTTEATRDDLKLLVAKHPEATRYEDLLREFIEERSD